jgi:hypothetical protein
MRGEVTTGRQQTEARVQEVAKSSYLATLNAKIPDIASISKSPQFKKFLEGIVPYSGGRTVRSALKAAHEAQDVETVATIVADFRRQLGARPPAPTPAHFAQPTGAGGLPTAQPDPGASAKLPWSKRVEAGEQFRKRQISAEEFAKISQLYTQAAAENRIDMSA